VVIAEIMVLVGMVILVHGTIPYMKIVNNDNIIMLECIIVNFSAFEYISSYILVYIVAFSYCINKHSAMPIVKPLTGTKEMSMKDWILMSHE
jgi:hypothetical protein